MEVHLIIHIVGRLLEEMDNINNLTAGDYTLTITDNRSCTESFEVTITEPESQ